MFQFRGAVGLEKSKVFRFLEPQIWDFLRFGTRDKEILLISAPLRPAVPGFKHKPLELSEESDRNCS